MPKKSVEDSKASLVSFQAEGTYLSVRFAFLRTDLDPKTHRDQANFVNDEPAIFQGLDGAIDGWAQGNIKILGFDEPYDGIAIMVQHDLDGPNESRLLAEAGSDEVGLAVAQMLNGKLSTNDKLNRAVAELVMAFWTCDDEFDEFEESAVDLIDADVFEHKAQDGTDGIEAKGFGGALLLEFSICSGGIEAEVSPDGEIITGDEFDLGDSGTCSAQVLLKPKIDVGLRPAKE